jgi:hypothetical protein
MWKMEFRDVDYVRNYVLADIVRIPSFLFVRICLKKKKKKQLADMHGYDQHVEDGRICLIRGGTCH